jgi:hypothetical protein
LSIDLCYLVGVRPVLIIEGPEDFSHVARNDLVLDYYLLAAEHAITITEIPTGRS